MEIRTEGARNLFAYWDGLRAGRPLPRATDIDLVDIAPLLPDVVIYAATPDNDFRFRFFGTALVRAIGTDLTGLHFREIMEQSDAAESIEIFSRLLAKPCAAVNVYQPTALEGGDHETEHLLLPLSDKNGVGVEFLCHAKIVAAGGEPKTFDTSSFSGQKIIHQQVMPLGQ